ncbi:MAG: hypothetical protein Solumvirus2_11 [Solumvirus sp.]|uniref:Uncharacterized protein n=1 Tax=Solumvirus sp. TaxID=2487773 RepID=A0A3G5AHY9_9VIRU|nr:MAG: hypothetical protein Solumvirus2_11 [Solumvirus sp.]
MSHILERTRKRISLFQRETAFSGVEDTSSTALSGNGKMEPGAPMRDARIFTTSDHYQLTNFMVSTGIPSVIEYDPISKRSGMTAILPLPKFITSSSINRNNINKIQIIDCNELDIDKLNHIIRSALTYQFFDMHKYAMMIAIKENGNILFRYRNENDKYHGLKITHNTSDINQAQYYWHGEEVTEEVFCLRYSYYLRVIHEFLTIEIGISRMVCDYLHDIIL